MFDQIKKDLIEAMKSQDKFKLDCIRMLKSSIQNETINAKHDLSDDEVIAVIKREVKRRSSSIEEYKKYNKTEVVENLEREISILNAYLPEELSEEDLIRVIDDTILELNATTIKDMGPVIKSISAKVGIRADMAKVSKIVKEKLN